ncbi:MAG: hypothetical protein MJE68_27045 [Proteobacteria bacterium]|nr:hypothetical protein [Pseudomonadota bacterium]
MSEGSGAITDTSSPRAGVSTTSIDRSTCGSSITGDLTDLLVKGTMMKTSKEKDTPAESLLKFSQSVPEHQPYEFDSIGERVGNEIEVCCSPPSLPPFLSPSVYH